MRPRRSRQPRGLTLVEALAGTAILAGVLTTSLVAAGRLQVQSRRAGQVSAACGVAQGLLLEWRENGWPAEQAGQVELPDRSTWWWQVVAVDNPRAQLLGARVIEMQVADQPPPAQPLASVQVLVEDEPKDRGNDPARTKRPSRPDAR